MVPPQDRKLCGYRDFCFGFEPSAQRLLPSAHVGHGRVSTVFFLAVENRYAIDLHNQIAALARSDRGSYSFLKLSPKLGRDPRGLG